MAKGPVKRLLDLAAKEFPEVSETFGIATPRRTKADAPTLAVKSDVVEPLAVRPQIAIRTKPSGIIAYHGSPHSFDRFDMSKIGTGEGAQAYGHGLYFAENPDVARSYRDALAEMRVGLKVNNKRITPPAEGKPTPEEEAADFVISMSGFDNPYRRATGETLRADKAAVEAFNSVSYNTFLNDKDAVRRVLAEWAGGGNNLKLDKASKGSMYQVRIDADPADFLDYDSPLSVQPRAMQALRDVDLNAIKEGNRTRVMLERALQGAEQTEYPAKGQTLSVGLDTIFGNNSKPASDFLNERGLRGVKYLDQGSRIAGDGTSNFVVFDDELVNILKRYRDGGLAVKKKGKPRVSKRKAFSQSSPNSST